MDYFISARFQRCCALRFRLHAERTHKSPQTTKGSEKANVASTALKHWQDKLAAKEETTRAISRQPNAEE
jgi:hypothetical protein